MPAWDEYPQTYRFDYVQAITAAARAGECSALVGLSGSGKSNLLGFLAHRLGEGGRLAGTNQPQPAYLLVDCNRLPVNTPQGIFQLLLTALHEAAQPGAADFARVEGAVGSFLKNRGGLCFLFDRFDAATDPAIASNLRALRDSFKYSLTLVTAGRRPPPAHSELAELFYAHTLWLDPLNTADARWTVERYAARQGLQWDEPVIQSLISVSQAYPAFLRAACEAYAAGCPLDSAQLAAHPAVRRRLDEFWTDQPGSEELEASGLGNHPWLAEEKSARSALDTAQLTAKEHLLWQYLQAHPQEVCEKDDLIRAIWPEDRIFTRGVRDDSLAQLVRRLREKVEPDASNPRFIHTIPGRGYRFIP